MVARSEKKSARDLCKCGHWREAHNLGEGTCMGCPLMEGPFSSELCPCNSFRSRVHPAELTKGSRS